MGINYKPLSEHLNQLSKDGNHNWETSFDEIEGILKNKLPSSASNHRSSWANTNKGPSRAWVTLGWKTRKVDMSAKTLAFRYIGDALITKKSPNKIPMNKPASREGLITESAPMMSVDVATKQDIQTLGDNLTSKMDVQKKEMDIEHIELKQAMLKHQIVTAICIVIAVVLLGKFLT